MLVPDRLVTVTVWNEAEQRSGADVGIIKTIVLLFKMGYIVNGLPCYATREEAQGTFYAQGPAERCLDRDYYYADGLRMEVSMLLFFYKATSDLSLKDNVPVQHDKETADEVFRVFESKFPFVDENWRTIGTPIDTPRSIQEQFPSKHRYARFETIQQCLTIGRPLDDANISTELFPTILAALKGKLVVSIKARDTKG